MPVRLRSSWNRPHEETLLLEWLRVEGATEGESMSNRYGDGARNMWAAADRNFTRPMIGTRTANANLPMDTDALRSETRLALAVVCTAVNDIHRGSRRRYVRESNEGYAQRKHDAVDAEHFLLRRINQEGDCWGDVLRQWGMKPLTRERLAHLVRSRAFLTLEHFIAA